MATIEQIKYMPPSTIHGFLRAWGAEALYLQGPFGSGKSVGGCWKLYGAGKRSWQKYHMPRRSLIVRNTWETLKQTTWKSFMEWFASLGEWRESKKTFYMPSQQHEFVFAGLDRPKDVAKVKSLEITDFMLDEASEIVHDIFLALQGRKGRYPKIENKAAAKMNMDPQALCVSNPPDDEHWLVDEFDKNPKAGYFQFLQPSGVSPEGENIENLPRGYYENLLEQYSSRPDLIQRYVHGKRAVVVRGKAVYQFEFSRPEHVSTQPLVWPEGKKILRGWDASGNVPAAVVGWLTPSGRWDIAKEFVTDRAGIRDFGQRLTAWCRSEFPDAEYIDVGDPATFAEFSDPHGGLTSNAKILKAECGVDMKKGVQAFRIRRDALGERLAKRGRLLIYGPGAPRLAAGLEGGYSFPQLSDNRGYGGDPIKNQYSHVVEAAQYLATYLDGLTEQKDDSAALAKLLAKKGQTPWDG